MTRTSDEQLTKITLNLYTRDVEWFKANYDWGYSEAIRKAVRAYINTRRRNDAEHD